MNEVHTGPHLMIGPCFLLLAVGVVAGVILLHRARWLPGGRAPFVGALLLAGLVFFLVLIGFGASAPGTPWRVGVFTILALGSVILLLAWQGARWLRAATLGQASPPSLGRRFAGRVLLLCVVPFVCAFILILVRALLGEPGDT